MKMKATGIVRRIDELGRVVIPKEIRRTLRIREGDSLEIYTDREGGVILKKYSPIGELGDFAKEYAESVYQSVGCIVVICDKDSIIAVSGLKRGQQSANMGIAIDKPIHTDIEKAIVERTKVNLSSSRNETMLRIASGDSDMQYCAELIVPILSSGDAIGAVILISAELGTVFGQAETKVAETAASFMGKQLEN
ncbi:MAG: stage V sporulation protein T [Clostridium sp.]|nr:stage V sporulation protein T [Clostridium sp.]